MKKLIYKDEVYYYKHSRQGGLFGLSSAKVFIERDNFFKYIKRYKKIGEYESVLFQDVTKEAILIRIVNKYLKKRRPKKADQAKPLIIDRSPEIEALYK